MWDRMERHTYAGGGSGSLERKQNAGINIQLTLRYYVIYEYYKIICSDLHMHLHVEVEPQNDITLI